MPGIVRLGNDKHVGHAGPNRPFHQTSYNEGSPDVYVNGSKAVRVGDKTACGDPATAGSGTVYINGKKVHREGDATGGHDGWVPNKASSGSGDVSAGG